MDGRYILTPKGKGRHEDQRVKAADRLILGREQIRASIEKDLGYRLADMQFDKIWKIVQEKMAHFFYMRGQEMVFLVSRLIAEASPVTSEETRPSIFFIDELANAIAETSKSPDQQAELRQAFTDLFEQPAGPAFQWLLEICSIFVALCSLGLEGETGRALAKILHKTALVLDTDVILSLLGEAEPAHEGVLAVTKRWRLLGGGLWVGKEVLEEVAYHAWIAQIDYEGISRWLPGSEKERATLIENVFARSFAELLASKKARRHQWNAYLGQYRGTSKYDTSRVSELLRTEHNFNILPGRSRSEEEIEAEAREQFMRQIRDSQSVAEQKIAEDKARRDAALYAGIQSFIRKMNEEDPERSCILVSSSRRMRQIEAALGDTGERELVVPIGGILYLLSLVPDVSIGLGAMKAFLFDSRRQPFSDAIERLLLRVARDSEEVDMPWAKRSTLVREFKKRLLEDARRSGKPVERREDRAQIEEGVLQESELQKTAVILKESLDAIAPDTRLRTENIELRNVVERLRGEVERLKRLR